MSANAPLLLRAARGEQVERPPVWMMRQAGRYMKVYRDLRDRHPGFRERSENPDLSYEISMQPFHAFKPDGVILFSDILTPLPGMGIDFDIVESKGPLIQDPIRTMAQVEALRPLQPAESMPFVGEVLTRLRSAVGNEAAVLGFVGAPWTLAAYVVEGKSSKNYAVIKAMAFQEPQLLHRLLDHFAESIAAYLRYQIDSGAQVVQMFDSWAGQLSPMDYDTFAAPYQKKVVDLVKQTHPDTPFILYISGSAGVIERMARTGLDRGHGRRPGPPARARGCAGQCGPRSAVRHPGSHPCPHRRHGAQGPRPQAHPQPGPRHPAWHPRGKRRRLL
jgi:uroporphyrinogen decarboxylase